MSQSLLDSILTLIFISILPIITGFLVAWLKKKTADLEAKTKNETLNKYISLAENIIETCVVTVSQTYVDTLKNNRAFDKAAQAEAFEMCKQKVLSLLSSDVKEVLNKTYSSQNDYIDSRIEYCVNMNKRL